MWHFYHNRLQIFYATQTSISQTSQSFFVRDLPLILPKNTVPFSSLRKKVETSAVSTFFGYIIIIYSTLFKASTGSITFNSLFVIRFTIRVNTNAITAANT